MPKPSDVVLYDDLGLLSLLRGAHSPDACLALRPIHAHAFSWFQGVPSAVLLRALWLWVPRERSQDKFDAGELLCSVPRSASSNFRGFQRKKKQNVLSFFLSFLSFSFFFFPFFLSCLVACVKIRCTARSAL